MEEMNIEKLLDELIEKASGPVIQKLTEEDLKHLDDAYPYEISEEHERKMQEIFKMAGYARSSKSENENQDEDETGNANKVKFTRKSSFRKILLVAAVIGIVLAIGCVGAFRESFVKYYLDIKEECSGVKKNDSYEFNIDNIYFGYMPSEYEVVNRKEEKDLKKIGFENNTNGTYITLDIINKEYGKEINTEDAKIEDVVINEKDMVYSERDDMKILTWKENGKVFVLQTNETKDFLLKVAKNISFID